MILYTNKHKIPFQIDDADYDRVSQRPWFIDAHGYPTTNVKEPKKRPINLHKFLLGSAPNGLEWDHINRDKLDNRRANLRVATHAENMGNRNRELKRVTNTSGHRGIYRQKNRWRAMIHANGRLNHLGSFVAFDDAVAARLRAEVHFAVACA